MAVRMALFRTASKEPKDKPKARVKAKPAPVPTAKFPAKPARTPARDLVRKSVRKPVRKPAPKAAQPRTRAQARTKAPTRTWPWAKAAPPATKARPRPRPRPRPKAKPEPVPEPEAGAESPYTPLLQRRSWGATLARVLVLAAAIVGMVAFAVALAKVTLVPSPASVSLIHSNLRPGHSIRAYLDGPSTRDAVRQIGGNLLLGVPFGILLPMLFPKARGLLRVGLLTGLVMLMVETTQGVIIVGRSFDIDDVILNTAGALIGYLLLGLRLGRALYPRRHHWWQRQSGQQRNVGRADVRPGRRPAQKRP